jgi:hypothetical protein
LHTPLDPSSAKHQSREHVLNNRLFNLPACLVFN